ncbi:unnamed protein product [Rhodiola kirilowii]
MQTIEYLRKFDAFMSTDHDTPSAMLEKEQGNEYFKQKKFKEAIDCYSRSIGLSPTAVVYANRAMAYLKIRRFKEAEDDCTEALNLDDRYIKGYSRRSTARKELKKYKESMEDADFALKLEPNNQEDLFHRTTQGAEKTKGTSVHLQELSSPPIRSQKTTLGSAMKEDIAKRKHLPSKLEQKPSVIWRGFSGDRALEARLLKATSPSVLPRLFKNALTSTMLVDIVRCLATIFREEMELTVQYLENLTKVSRFDMVILCLSQADKTVSFLTFSSLPQIPMEYAERLDSLRHKYSR